jgi:hypothetical protein
LGKAPRSIDAHTTVPRPWLWSPSVWRALMHIFGRRLDPVELMHIFGRRLDPVVVMRMARITDG